MPNLRQHLSAWFRHILPGMCLLLASASAWSQDLFPPPPTPTIEAVAPTDLETRLQQLEDQLRQQSQRQAELEQELAAKDDNDQPALSQFEKRLSKLEMVHDDNVDAARKKADERKNAPIKLNGRFQGDYWTFPYTSPGANAFETGDSTDSVDDRFLLRRLRFTFSGNLYENMRYKIDLEFSNPSDPGFRDAYFGWDDLPVLQTMLIGNQKRPYGLDALYSTNYTIFLERPAIVDAFNNNYRRFGIQSYGVSENEAWNWRYGAFMLEDVQQTGITTTSPNLEVYQAEFAGRLANTYWYDEPSGGRYYGHLGLSGSVANVDGTDPDANEARFRSRPEARTTNSWLDTGTIAGAQFYELAGFESVATFGPLQLTGELMQVWLQRDAASQLSFHGGYITASYFLTGEHMPWDRQTGCIGRVHPFENFFLVRTEDGSCAAGWGAWQLTARYSVADLSDDNIRGGVLHEGTLGLVWYWSAYAKLILNVDYGSITEHAPIDGFGDGRYTVIGTRCALDY